MGLYDNISQGQAAQLWGLQQCCSITASPSRSPAMLQHHGIPLTLSRAFGCLGWATVRAFPMRLWHH